MTVRVGKYSAADWGAEGEVFWEDVGLETAGGCRFYGSYRGNTRKQVLGLYI
jgi:hypothetical protein